MIKEEQSSPRWSVITKLVVALALLVIAGALLVRFKNLFIPVVMAFVLSYLLHPLVGWISRKSRISWRASVNIIYLIFIVILGALLTWGGVGLVQQIQNLIEVIQENIDEIPAFIESLTSKVIQIGPLELDLSTFASGTIGQQLIGYIEPALGKLGGLVGSLAGSAAATIGWLFFVIVISYFFLLESDGLRNQIIRIEIPGYAEDLRRMGVKLGVIWNAYLRGQMIVFITTFIVYSIVLTILGVRYSFGVALVAGLANFLPYVGPAITWVTLGLVTYFQGYTLFGMTPFWYMLMVLLISILIDQVFNNLVIPRIMSQNLRVHPAFVLIAAFLGASLLGVVGVILAAPLLATIQLFGKYIIRKMLDRDPWPVEDDLPPPSKTGLKFVARLRSWWRKLRKKNDKGDSHVKTKP